MFSKKPEAPPPPTEHKHMWEKWEKARVTGMVLSGTETHTTMVQAPITNYPMSYPTTINKYTERQVDIQERRCTICGFYERQVLGYL